MREKRQTERKRGREPVGEYCIPAKINTVKSPLALAGACGGPIQKCRAMLNKHKFTSGSVNVSEMQLILIMSPNYSDTYNRLIFPLIPKRCLEFAVTINSFFYMSFLSFFPERTGILILLPCFLCENDLSTSRWRYTAQKAALPLRKAELINHPAEIRDCIVKVSLLCINPII